MLPALREWTGDSLPALAELGYEGETPILVLPIKMDEDHRPHGQCQ
jgi:hypothetical protein